ncbi:DUF7363 domain-containing protein [Agromyces sp. SYSU T0242]|uniref:DUF7363 domain-containing protein n=1 Tax=Agromyces litoreus TaxID=3158561 RepID=UPI003394473C
MDVMVIDAGVGVIPPLPADDADAVEAAAVDGARLLGCWRLPRQDPRPARRTLEVRFPASASDIDLDLVGVRLRDEHRAGVLRLLDLPHELEEGRLGRVLHLRIPSGIAVLALLVFETVRALEAAAPQPQGPPRMEGPEDAEEATDEATDEDAGRAEHADGEDGAAAPPRPRTRHLPPARRGPVFGMGEEPAEAAPPPPPAAPSPPPPPVGAAPPEAEPPPEAAPVPGTPDRAEPTPGPARPTIAHLLGEMPEHVRVEVPFAVRFGLSRRRIDASPGHTADRTVIPDLDAARPVTVTIVPRGFRMAADEPRTVELSLPEDDRVAWHEFTLVAPRPGRGEVALVVRQGGDLPLATLRLTAIASAVDDTADAPRSGVAAVTRPDPELQALPTIRIDEEFVDGTSTLAIRATVGDESAEGQVRLRDKRAYVARTYRLIDGIREQLRTTRDTAARGRIAARQLGALGRTMARDLLPPNVRALLWAHRTELDGLLLQTTGEVDLPWEIVHLVPPDGIDPADAVVDEDADDELFLSRLGLTRWVYGTAHPTEIRVAHGNARVICPEYRLARFRLTATAEERRLLEDRLQAALVQPEDAGGISAVVQAGFDLLHFAGHGHWSSADPPTQELILAEYDAQVPAPEWFYSDEELRTDLPDLGVIEEDASGPFVFLNACDLGRLPATDRSLGGFPEAFLRGGAAAFVGCSWSVGDDPAGSFVRAFYAALVDGADISEATRRGRRAAASAADATDLAFAVYAHPRARLHLT